MKNTVSLALFLIFVALVPLKGADRQVNFNHDIRPLLSDRCFRCHGPDEKARKAKLRLDTSDGALKAMKDGGFVIKPGSPGQSEAYRRITSKDPDDLMPPADSNLSLKPEEIELIKRWIEQGAEYQPHWSFIPVGRIALPTAQQASSGRNPIDAFVLERLEREGLTLSAAAPRETLIRRLSFDLTGLPPSLESIDAFLRDTSPDAYERLVDRLLNSPAYGERRANEWLDLARYADTYGYQSDVECDMSPWRDWVIRAFNENLPYDQFILWQLAGDLLPSPTRDQVLATAFNRLHRQTNEGGSIEEEYRAEYVADRIHTMGTAFLGLTMECARCHDHKYDPITQKDYYRMFAFFNNIDESGLYSHFTQATPSPTLLLYPAGAEAHHKSLKNRIKEYETALDSVNRGDSMRPKIRLTPSLSPSGGEGVRRTGEGVASGAESIAGDKNSGSQPSSLPLLGERVGVREGKPSDSTATARGQAEADDAHSTDLKRLAELSRSGFDNWLKSASRDIPQPQPVAAFSFEEVITNTTLSRVGTNLIASLVDGPVQVEGKSGKALQFTGDNSVICKGAGIFNRTTPFTFGLWLKPSERQDRAVVFHRSRAWTDSGSRGYELVLENGYPTFGLIHFWPGNAIRVRANASIPAEAWTHVTITYDGSSRAGGLRLYLNGEPAAVEVVRDNLFKDILHRREWGDGDIDSVHLTLAGRFRDSGFKNGIIDEFSVYDRCLTPLEVAGIAGVTVNSPDRDALFVYYVQNIDVRYREALAALRKLREEENNLVNGVREIMVMKEMPQRRPAYLLKRGAYDAPGEEVEPGTPNAIFPFPAQLPRDRLGLARWMVDRQNPLTARVIVNRTWRTHFGRGLVATAEDFGNQGQLPTHPELLDWLAMRFMEDGWDLKALHRLIVTSATYRQTSRATPELLAKDPENRLLARGPRHRLPAEEIRDNALAVSGLLSPRLGGASVKPYQPPGLWEESGTGKTYRQDKGEKLYRRSLYTFWRRTAPPPTMLTFDATTREVCTAKRETTATPLQALVLLNDPQFVEAARVLAERLVRESPNDINARIVAAFRKMTGRTPGKSERRVIHRLYAEQLALFGKDPCAAEDYLRTGDDEIDQTLPLEQVAATTVLSSALMNLDEFVTKR
ncbi:MAG TPA: DUF1553 domain-containing protein [Verrucomicrobiae bacterium]|nr:DUF1553 domain-containing protein [Verrucomicrobiae bacterium]